MIVTNNTTASVREWFRDLKKRQAYVTDKSGCKMLEVLGSTFVADEGSIFGKVDTGYVKREIEWYQARSLNVNDIPGGAPREWIRCATPSGLINSNYGYLIWDDANHFQYENAKKELLNNPESRRAVMIYTRPTMWSEYNYDGMSDFICTNTVQYFIRDEKLVALVQMRSNDVLYGYKNDKAWQDYVHILLAKELSCDLGQMIWHVGSLHVYERHFDLIK